MAYDFEADGLYYNITSADDLTVEVTYKTTSYNSYSGDIEIPSTVTNNGTTYSVTGIGGSAFYNCSNITSVAICSSVKEIGYMAFYNCSSLTEIIIPESVDSIGTYAFINCSSLTNLSLPVSSCTSNRNFSTPFSWAVITDLRPLQNAREICLPPLHLSCPTDSSFCVQT